MLQTVRCVEFMVQCRRESLKLLRMDPGARLCARVHEGAGRCRQVQVRCRLGAGRCTKLCITFQSAAVKQHWEAGCREGIY